MYFFCAARYKGTLERYRSVAWGLGTSAVRHHSMLLMLWYIVAASTTSCGAVISVISETEGVAAECKVWDI